MRHGQYAPENGGKLTSLGREQAQVTGRWIGQQHAGQSFAAMWSSTLPRARETASIIAEALEEQGMPRPRRDGTRVRATGILREGMYTKLAGFDVTLEERDQDRARADRAWAQFFKTSRTDRFELVVCHGNLIRYLVCRALKVPVGRWTRMNSHHCAMTKILVRDTGAVRVVSYNETAHLPPNLIT